MRTTIEINTEYENWLHRVADEEILSELKGMDDATKEDVFTVISPLERVA